jgi:diguanylate cyclase (GGDEF)-like protein/PAS domain S-box-containing protein
MSVRGLLRPQSSGAQGALADGDREFVLERAYAVARVAGGALAFVVAPAFGVPWLLVAAMVTCTVAGPGLLHMWLWRRTKTPAARERVRWLAVADDCMCAVFALAIFARDPMWSITLVVPLLIFVESIRAGAPGAIITTIVIVVAHVLLTDVRHTVYGITTDPTALFFQLGLYVLALILAVVIFSELQALQAMRAELFGPLIAAQDRFGDGVLIRRGDRFLFVGDAMRRITGYEPKDLETLPSMLSLVVPSEREAIAERLKLPGPDRFETRLLHKEGREVPVEIVRAEVRTSSDPRVVAVVRDITERRAIAQSLEFTALHDQLTGLPNRLSVTRAMDDAIAAKQGPCAVIVMHLAHFRDVRETFGHRAGDELLRHVAQRVRGGLRSMDVLGHDGAGVFTIVLLGADAVVAEQVARNVRGLFTQPFDVVGRPLLSAADLGIAAFPAHGTDATTLLRCAEIAASYATRIGRGIATYDASQDKGRAERLELLADLRDLLQRHELGVAFQPYVDIRTGATRGFEALARWEHPRRGAILPTAFIPLAEYSGLIKPLTEHMLGRALEECRSWQEAGYAVDVAVNVSIRNLADPDFPDLVARWLQMHQVAAERLVLEVTESLGMADIDEYVRTLTQLRRLGVRVALDDFGSGYSSLTQLYRLPVTQAKIDRGFIERMSTPDGEGVIRATVDIAHALGLETVAEGVPSPAVAARLRELGCDLAQGFGIGEPMPSSEVVPWLKAHARGTLRLVYETA